jgi:hypothetical protein
VWRKGENAPFRPPKGLFPQPVRPLRGDGGEPTPVDPATAVLAAVATAVVADLAHAKDVAINWPVLLDGGTNGAFCALGPILRHQRR